MWREGGGETTLAQASVVPLLGDHNVRNAMAALALARALGPVDDAVRAALGAFRGLPFRMQPAGAVGGIAFVNDSKATTVDAVAAAVEGLPGTVMLGLGGPQQRARLHAATAVPGACPHRLHTRRSGAGDRGGIA